MTGKARRLFATTALAGLASALALTVAAPAEAQSAIDRIKERGTLRVAGVEYRPFMIRNPDGSYSGIDFERLSAFAADLGVTLEVVDAGWDTAVAGVTTDKWDMVPAMCVTPARDEVVDFTDTYIVLGGALIVRADNDKGLTTPEAFNNPDVVFADVAGGWGESITLELAPDAQHKQFGQATDADIAQEVMSGRADAAIMNTPITTKLLMDRYGDEIAFVPGWDQTLDIPTCPVAYAIPDGDEAFRTFLNDSLKAFDESGETQALLDKWLTPETTEPNN